MASIYKKLGAYIRSVDVRNHDLAVTNLRGISTSKVFQRSLADTPLDGLTSYKIVREGQFAYVPDTSRRGDKVAIALLGGEDCVISSVYSVFEVSRKNELLPEYLMLWFKRAEFDRFARYRSQGTAREIFSWDDLCDTDVPVPSMQIQRQIVARVKAITDSIAYNDTCISKYQETLNLLLQKAQQFDKVRLGDHVQLVNEKNDNGEIKTLLGVNIQKEFFPSVANTTGIDLSKYSVVRQNRFACNLIHVGRDERIPLALYRGDDPAMVTFAYHVFEMLPESTLLPEFLYLWFCISDWDKHAWLLSASSIRGNLLWEDLMAFELPLPDVQLQGYVLTLYNAIRRKQQLNDHLRYALKYTSERLLSLSE